MPLVILQFVYETNICACALVFEQLRPQSMIVHSITINPSIVSYLSFTFVIPRLYDKKNLQLTSGSSAFGNNEQSEIPPLRYLIKIGKEHSENYSVEVVKRHWSIILVLSLGIL